MSGKRRNPTIGERVGGTVLLVFLGMVATRGPSSSWPSAAAPTPAVAPVTAPEAPSAAPRPSWVIVLPSGGNGLAPGEVDCGEIEDLGEIEDDEVLDQCLDD